MESEIIEVILPKLGESIVGATVVQWLKHVGEKVMVDEPLVEVSTDKVNSEIPSPVSGILKEICVREDQEIEVGALLALIESIPLTTARAAPEPSTPSQRTKSSEQLLVKESKEEVFSPAVLRMAQLEGISFEILRKIEGTGEGGRITKRDIERFVQSRNPPENELQQSEIPVL